jgi:hypothetical protein
MPSACRRSGLVNPLVATHGNQHEHEHDENSHEASCEIARRMWTGE